MPSPEVDTVLSADNVALAALGVLDDEGPDALSFRRVAAELGVSHTTVHRYCGNLEGMLDICAEHLAAQLPRSRRGLSWAVATERRFTALYELFTAHPGLVILQRGRPWLGPEMMRRFSEPAVRDSLAAGMTFTEVTVAHRELYMFTIGCALTFSSYDIKAGRTALAMLDPVEFPALTSNIHDYVSTTTNRDIFRSGLRHLIRALDPG